MCLALFTSSVRTKYGKRQFKQLLAVVCLMRCEDRAFHEAEVRLSEPSEKATCSQRRQQEFEASDNTRLIVQVDGMRLIARPSPRVMGNKN